MLEFDFSGKVAVLTGAASGMGFLTAKSFVRMGGSVVMADLNAEALERTVAEVNEIREGAAVGVVCDCGQSPVWSNTEHPSTVPAPSPDSYPHALPQVRSSM